MKLTIIIPVKNRLVDLKTCLRSIEGAQSTRVIVVDDHSDFLMSEALQAEFSWVEVILNTCGQGIGSARNCGLNLVKSEYVMFVDSDDVLSPGWEDIIMYDISNHPDKDIFVYPPTSFNETGVGERHKYIIDLLNQHKLMNSELSLANLKFRSLAVWSKVYKTKLLDDHQITFGSESMGEDVLFSTKVGLATNQFFISEQVWYQIRESNLSHTTSLTPQQWQVRLHLVIAQAKLIKEHVSPTLFKSLHFPIKHYLTRAVKGHASWIDITKYVVAARKLGIW
jgi:glycosyltransferase involved in cell wall biosynthesis